MPTVKPRLKGLKIKASAKRRAEFFWTSVYLETRRSNGGGQQMHLRHNF